MVVHFLEIAVKLVGRVLDALLQHNDSISLRERLWLLEHVVGHLLDLDSDTLRLEGHDGSSHVSPPPNPRNPPLG